MPKFTKRDKAVLTGLFLSKFGAEGMELMGLDHFTAAFNVLGYGLGVNPNSLKNYRDEFDPLFPNTRKGWHMRTMREHCKRIYDEFSALDLRAFSELIRGFLFQDHGIREILDQAGEKDSSETAAKRLITGKAAEEYFKRTYQKEPAFKNCALAEDATAMGCGFDFKLTCNSGFYCVEVKGLAGRHGAVSLTEKEYKVAGAYQERFCLFVVFNFIEKPHHKAYFNPLNSELQFKKNETRVTQITYRSTL